MSSVSMKMAKASKDDINRVREFFQFVEEYLEYGTYTKPDDDYEEESIDLTEKEFVEMLRERWGGRLTERAGVDCSWSRVVCGCDMLIDNCCDPLADTLEWRKDVAAFLAGKDEPA